MTEYLAIIAELKQLLEPSMVEDREGETAFYFDAEKKRVLFTIFLDEAHAEIALDLYRYL
jgi:hypothetical protein